jgi:hypothetical protein
MLATKVPYIKVFKLVSEIEIITKVVEENKDYYTVFKARQLIQGQKGIQLGPYFVLTDNEKNWELSKALVIGRGDPISKLLAEYESQLSGITVPEKGIVLT